jgi:hypothetical protein
VREEEKGRRRWPAYEQAKAERDEVAAVLRDIYPGIEQKLRKLLRRIAATDDKVEYINYALPSGARRLLPAELVARGLGGFVRYLPPCVSARDRSADSAVDPVIIAFLPERRYDFPP